jgi:dual specificity tyrosine-phosphorylation-regulated kinase 2/3/4
MKNEDYVYGFDIINNSEFSSSLTKREREELKSRKSPVYYINLLNTPDKPFYCQNNRLEVSNGDNFDYRYEVLYSLGKGAFSNVYLCKDHKYDADVAVKVIRNERRFHKQVRLEIEIYELLYKSENYSPFVIKLLKAFEFRKNRFLVFDNYGIDLYSYYKKNMIDSYDLKMFAYQIVKGVEFLHSFEIIHMDLKPENILVRNKHLKIIDLGSSFIQHPKMIKNYVQSRYYRSPDVVFGLETTTKIDIWSYGCILYEMATRRPLIPAKSSKDLVLYYTHILGYPPKDMECFYTDNDFFVKQSKKLPSLKCERGKYLQPNNFEWKHPDIILKQLILHGCLGWDNSKRLSASELLKHPYFSEYGSDDSNSYESDTDE